MANDEQKQAKANEKAAESAQKDAQKQGLGQPADAAANDPREMTDMVIEPEEAQEKGYFGQVTKESEEQQANSSVQAQGKLMQERSRR